VGKAGLGDIDHVSAEARMSGRKVVRRSEGEIVFCVQRGKVFGLGSDAAVAVRQQFSHRCHNATDPC
jgi:hypothetical protein